MITERELDESIGVAPPFSVDVDGLIERERRNAWLRRGGATAATAAAVVVVAFASQVALGWLPPARTETPIDVGVMPAAPLSTPPATPPPAPILTMPGADPTEAPEAAIARLEAALAVAVHKAALAATLTGDPVATLMDVPDQFVFEYDVRQLVQLNGVSGRVDVVIARRIQPPVEDGNRPPWICPEPADLDVYPNDIIECQDSVNALGEHVQTMRTRGVNDQGSTEGHKLLENWVTVWRLDGSMVQAKSSNDQHLGDGGTPPRAYHDGQPPLNIAQLTAMAHDPTLTIYP